MFMHIWIRSVNVMAFTRNEKHVGEQVKGNIRSCNFVGQELWVINHCGNRYNVVAAGELVWYQH
jgi:hypothetical protein